MNLDHHRASLLNFSPQPTHQPNIYLHTRKLLLTYNPSTTTTMMTSITNRISFTMNAYGMGMVGWL